MANRFILNETSYFGPGSISVIPDEVAARGFKKAFVVTDKSLMQFKVATKVLKVLDDAKIAYAVFDDVKPNPTIENVQSGVAAFKAAGADFIISIGGGSAMDTGKAVGIIINNPEQCRRAFAGRRRTDQEQMRAHHRCSHHCRNGRGGYHQLRYNRRGEEAQIRLR